MAISTDCGGSAAAYPPTPPLKRPPCARRTRTPHAFHGIPRAEMCLARNDQQCRENALSVAARSSSPAPMVPGQATRRRIRAPRVHSLGAGYPQVRDLLLYEVEV